MHEDFEEEYFCECDHCHFPIEYGAEYYDIDGIKFCEDCAKEWFDSFKRRSGR